MEDKEKKPIKKSPTKKVVKKVDNNEEVIITPVKKEIKFETEYAQAEVLAHRHGTRLPIAHKISDDNKKGIDDIHKAIFGDPTLVQLVSVHQAKESIGTIMCLDFECTDTNTAKQKNVCDFDEYAVLGLKPTSQMFATKKHAASVTHKNELASDLKSWYGIDVKDIIVSQLIQIAKNELFEEVIDKIDSISNKYYLSTLTRWDKIKSWVYKLFKKQFIKKLDVENNVEKIVKKIFLHGNLISADGMRGPANSILVSSGMLSALQESAAYIHANVPSNIDKLPVQRVGQIGNFKIFVDYRKPWKDNSIIVFRNNSTHEPGLYLPWHEESTSVISISERSNPQMEAKAILNIGYNLIETKNTEKFYKKFYVNYFKD